MLTVKWTRAALQDVDDTMEYISQESIKAALDVAKKIHRACTLLQDMPSLGREGRYPGLREWVISGIPYTLWYRVNEQAQALEIIRVLHDARKRP